MDLSQQQKNLIIELIKDKFHMNKENIQYCENYINDAFLMEETKEERKKNIEANKKLIVQVRKQQVELYDLFTLFSEKSIRHIYN